MRRYAPKEKEIKAIQFNKEGDYPGVKSNAYGLGFYIGSPHYVEFLRGDYIIEHLDGTISSMSETAFKKMYEEVEE